MKIKSLGMKLGGKYMLSYGGLVFTIKANSIQKAIAILKKQVNQ